MHKITVSGGPLTLGSGELALLSKEQLASRRHNVEVIKEHKDGSADVRVVNVLMFKEGEELTLNRIPKASAPAVQAQASPEPDKGRAPSKKALQAARDEGFDAGRTAGIADLDNKVAEAKQAGRAEMLAEVQARNALFETLEGAEADLLALAADASDEEKAMAQKAVDDAQAAVDALQPLVA